MDYFQYPKIAPQTHTKHIIKFLDWRRGVSGLVRSGQILDSSRVIPAWTTEKNDRMGKESYLCL